MSIHAFRLLQIVFAMQFLRPRYSRSHYANTLTFLLIGVGLCIICQIAIHIRAKRGEGTTLQEVRRSDLVFLGFATIYGFLDYYYLNEE